jgi:succinyl-CoA synthetase alpha subunit
MAIFADNSTRVVVQGITGRDGSFHTRQMIDYGTTVVAGVTPGKGGQKFDDRIPIFDTVEEAVHEEGATASVIYVPAAFAAAAICEAADSGVELIVCISEGIPVLDMLRSARYVEDQGARLIGPNCPGMISPGQTKLGIIPGQIVQPGPVGVVSRSGTLTYEVVWALTREGLGQSSCIGIGGDPVIGTNFIDCLDAFEKDPQTEAIVLIGEIGGTDEQNAARYIKENLSKPVVGFVAGQTAPPGRRMGHAGAIISGSSGTAEEKISTFKENGVAVAERPVDMPGLISKALNG